jgi:hypothetical protein
VRRDDAPRPTSAEPAAPTPPDAAERSRRLRSRLMAAIASAVAVAFGLTVAGIAGSPAPRPADDTAPTAGPTDATAGSLEPAPPVQPELEREPDPWDEGQDPDPDPPAEAPEPGPTADPSPAPAPTAPQEPAPPASPVETSPAPNDHGALLWGRWFRADHLRQDRELAPVAGDEPLYVGFLRQERGDSLVWMTSCNTFGGDLTVRRDRLRVRDIGGTAVDCEDEVQEFQEAWLADFFAANPNWRSIGERLRLSASDGRLIDLTEDPDGPGPPWS